MTRHTVLRSIEIADGGRCVDLFVRRDATYGFEEFRRDAEDGLWFPVGHHADLVFDTEAAALDAALSKVAWLGDAIGSR